MSKKRNVFACLLCLVLAFFCLVSCVPESPEKTAKTQAEKDAQEVLNKLVWDEEDRTNVVSSLTFATQNKNYPGVTISWSSSEEDIIATNGKVNRPNSDDPRNVLVGEDLVAKVVITATVTAKYSWTSETGSNSAATDPIAKQFEFTVLAKPEGTDTGTIKDVKLRAWNYIYVEQGVDKALVSNSSITYNVILSGVVTAKLNADGATKGFMLHDGTDGIYVYGDNSNVKIGDAVEVIGGVYSYYGSLQVGSNVSVSKSSEKFTVPAYTEVTPQQWEDQNKGLGDEVIGHLGGDLYKVEGYLTASYNATTKDEYCITDAQTGEVSWIYYKSYNAEMKAQLEALVGEYVKVTGAGYDRDSRIIKNHLLWDGGIEKAEAPKVDDETKANVLLSQITLKEEYDADFDLNTNGVWEIVSGTGVEIVEGVAKVTQADAAQVVVLKVSVTVGEATVSKELTVTIKAIVKETPKHAGTKEDPYTVSDAVLICGGLADQEKTDNVYAIGTIKEITELSTSYGNGTFVITDGKSDLIVYRCKYLNNEKFTSEDQIKVGDVVVIYGQLTNYGGKLEFNSGCYIDSFVEEPIVEEGPFKTDYAYKFEVVQGNTNQTLYLTGNYKNTYYGESTTDLAAAADIYVVAVEGGYNLKLVQTNGTVLYINVVASGTHRNIKFEAAASSVWNYNEELQTFTTLVEGTEYYVGTYGTYDTISPSSIDKAATSFVGHLFDANQGQTPEPPVHEHEFVEGVCSCGEKDPNYVAPEVPAEGLAEGVAYVIGAANGKGTLYFNGTQSSGRFNGTYTKADATKVYVEAVEGNFKLYFFAGDVKTYIVIADTSTGGSFTTDAAAATVFEWNAEKQTLAVAEDSNNRGFGVGATSTYDNFSCYDLTGAYNWGQFEAVEGDVVTPEPPVHEHKFVEGKCECGEKDPNYVAPEVPAEGLAEGVAYVIGAANGKGTLYFNGTQSSGRFNGTYTKADATKVYVEAVEGNFKLYFFAGDVKTYIVIADTSTGGSFTTDAAAATVFEWNAEKQTLAVAEDSNNRAFGVGATSTYDNFSCYDLTGSYNWGQFEAVEGVVTPEPPVHEHKFVEGKCECGEEDPNYVAPEVSENFTVTMSYTAGKTTNMTGENDAALLGLDAAIFSAVSTKTNNGNNHVGLNQANNIRLYKNETSTLTLSVAEGYEIVSIKVVYASSTKANGKLLVKTDVAIELADGVYNINASSVALSNVGTDQVHISSIEIVYCAK